jgi:hypothetical protein
MFADYFLQTGKMLAGRDRYVHVGRIQHAGIHALGSVIVFVVLGAPIGFTVVVALIEWVVHFHIDFAKAKYSEKQKLDPTQTRFWQAFGVDQALHQLTYIAMFWAWIVYCTDL